MEKSTHVAPFQLQPIGRVRSSLKRLEDCPRQVMAGAPDAWVEILPGFAQGLDGIVPGDEVVLLTWLHKARRDTLKCHPQGDPKNTQRGVFSTRSPNRPNPVGMHRIEVLEVDAQGRLRVRALEALDGTPVIDIKPALHRSSQ